MSASFDPYHRWLGIPPKHQPADYYRLLALERFEDDPEVIADAAERQIAHVRRYQLGPHAELSQRILNELATAKACLLTPAKKAEYDQQLRESLPAEEPAPPAVAPPPEPWPLETVGWEVPRGGNRPSPAMVSRRVRPRLRPVIRTWLAAKFRGLPSRILVLGMAGGGILLGLVIALVWVLLPSKPDRGPVPVSQATLVFSWPAAERSNATLWIDGVEKSLREDGDTELPFAVAPGTHQVYIKREHFEPIRLSDLKLANGETRNVPLLWRKAAEPAGVETSATAARKEPKSVPQPEPANSPFDADRAKEHQRKWAEYLGVEVELTNSIGMKFQLIPPGVFLMGSPSSEARRGPDETQHRVGITRPYYMGVYEVTQGEYERVIGTNPSRFSSVSGQDTSRFPVEQVRWDDAIKFCQLLSALPDEKKPGRVYRLPTEAEWEYACRAGTTTRYHFGDTLYETQANSIVGDDAEINKQSLPRTAMVGSYRANAFGLCDMHGNVAEWCADWYAAYPSGTVTDPAGPSAGSSRVLRGGRWYSINARNCQSACRSGVNPVHSVSYVGFRVVLEE